ncbi:MAG: DUF58 domain-containing protein [Gaiellales bacterium]
MSRRTGVSVVAVAAVVAAWSLGSTVIATAGLTLTVVAVATWAWGRQVARRAGVTRLVETRKLVEGDSLRYRIVRTAPRLPGTFVLEESLSRLGVQSLELTRPTTEARLPAVPRGRIRLGPSRLVATDPLGLESVVIECERVDEVIVRPRLPELGTLATDGSGRLRVGTGSALRQPLGTELHAVREYRAGEPLRAVHWGTTARRGRLMVRELEEPAVDDVVIVLDLDGRADVGPPGSSSLDDAVRIAGGLVRAHRARGRAVKLVVAAQTPRTLTLRTAGELEAMLDVLAVAEPRRSGSWTGTGAISGPVVLVTPRAESAVSSRQRLDAVVLVDAASYGAEPSVSSTARLLGAAGRGVAVSVVRAGDDLAGALAGGRR